MDLLFIATGLAHTAVKATKCDVPLQTPSWCSPGTALGGPELRTWPTSLCCAEPAITQSISKDPGGRRRHHQPRWWGRCCVGVAWTHQSVVQADVSLQATLPVFKLHNRHFSCSDGQYVPQACSEERIRVSSRQPGVTQD